MYIKDTILDMAIVLLLYLFGAGMAWICFKLHSPAPIIGGYIGLLCGKWIADNVATRKRKK